MTLHLPPFDPSRTFVCKARFLAAGRWWKKDEIFDKSLVTARVVRLLYDARKISYATDDEAKQAASAARTSGLADLINGFIGAVVHTARSVVGLDPTDREERINRLVKANTREKLVELADGLEYPEGATKAVIAGAMVDAGRDGSA